MTSQEKDLLFIVKSPPAMFTASQTGTVFGTSAENVAILAAAKLIQPLGRPAQNAPKLYASVTILELCKDPAFLHRCALAISAHWARKRARKRINKNGLPMKETDTKG